MKKYFLAIIVVISILGCVSQNETEIPIIEIDNANIQSFKPIDEYIDTICFIKLKMPNGKFMALVNDVIEYNHKFYIHDQMGNQLLIFNENGDYIKQVGKIGEGPMEYGNIKRFFIDKSKNEIQLYDSGQQKIINFDTDGNFKRVSSNNYYTEDKAFLNDYQILFSQGYDNKHITRNRNFKFLILNKQDKFLKGVDNFSEKELFYIKNVTLKNYSFFNEKLLHCDAYNDTILEFTKKYKTHPRYLIHFKKDAPTLEQAVLVKSNIKEANKEKYPYLYKYFVEKEKICLLNYSYNQGYIHFAIYDKLKKETVINSNAVTYKQSLLPTPNINANQSMVTILDPEFIKILRKLSPLVKKNTSSEDTVYSANPYLLVYRFKN